MLVAILDDGTEVKLDAKTYGALTTALKNRHPHEVFLPGHNAAGDPDHPHIGLIRRVIERTVWP